MTPIKKQTLLNKSEKEASYAVLVLRIFTERVREFSCISSHDRPMESQTSHLVIEPPFPKVGGRKNRCGYNLLLVFDSPKSPKHLPPCARQQISWAARIDSLVSYSRDGIITTATVNTEDGKDYPNTQSQSDDMYNDITLYLYKEILQKLNQITNPSKHVNKIRFDSFPKELGELICNKVEQIYCQSTVPTIPLQFTKSAQHATLICTIIQNTTVTSNDFYLGIATPFQHFNELNNLMNDYATNEIKVISSHHNEDSHATSKIPVSRAYYKLKEVCDEYFSSTDLAFIRSHGIAVDVGASPGGWTQVLKYIVGLPKVICIDPGSVATRVTDLDGVIYIRDDVRSETSILALAKNGPYPLLVCDASVDNYLIFELLQEALSNVQRSLGGKPVLTLPCFMLITLKFSYKTESSIQRNLEKAVNALPDRIASLASCTVPSVEEKGCVNFEYKILHLMANSPSERTVLIKFTRINPT